MKATGLCGVVLGFGLLTFMVPVQGLENTQKPIDRLLSDARSKVSEGDKEGAAALYHRALQMDSSNKEARGQLFTLLVEAQSDAPAEEQPEVLQIITSNIQDPVQAPVNFSLPYLENGVLTSHDGSMSQAVLVILQKLQNNDNEAAVKLARNLKKQHPSHPVPYNLLGLGWQGLGDPSQAREFFQKALELQENFHAARINLAELELLLGEFTTAHQELDMVLKRDDHNRRACLVKAQLYNLEGQPEIAKEWYSKVSENL